MGNGHDELDLAAYGISPASQGGLVFCGVTEHYAIDGRRFQWPRGIVVTWALDFARLGELSDLDCKGELQNWADAVMANCGLILAYSSNPRTAHIRVTAEHIDGKSGVLGDMQIPMGSASQKLKGRFDTGEPRWTIAANPPAGYIDFGAVGWHEGTHALGLGHRVFDRNNPSLMHAMYQPGIRRFYPPDIAELQLRYGPPTAPPEPPISEGDSLGVDVIITTEAGKFKLEGKATRVK